MENVMGKDYKKSFVEEKVDPTVSAITVLVANWMQDNEDVILDDLDKYNLSELMQTVHDICHNEGYREGLEAGKQHRDTITSGRGGGGSAYLNPGKGGGSP